MNKEICPNCTSASVFHDSGKEVAVVDCKTCDSTGVISSLHRQLLDWGFNEVSSPTGSKLEIHATFPPDQFSNEKRFVDIKINRIGEELELESFKINNEETDRKVVDLDDAVKFCEKYF